MKEILQLLRLSFREKRLILLSLAANLFVALFTYLFVNLVQPIIDKLFPLAPDKIPSKTRLLDVFFERLHVSDADLRWVLPLLVIIVIAGKGLFTYFSTFFMKAVGHKVVKRVRDDLYARLIQQSAGFFDRRSTGELMSRLTNDVDKIQQAVSGSLGDLVEEVFILIALLVTVFVIDWHLALALFIVAPLAIVPLAAFSRQLKKKSLQGQTRMARIYELLHETIAGHRIVKAFTNEEFEIKRFVQATYSYYKTNIKLARIGSMASPFMEFIGGIAGAFILYFGTSRIAQGHISPGDFGAFVMAVFSMYMPIRRLSRANNQVQQGVASWERIKEILNAVPQIQDPLLAYPLPPVKGRVRFEGVAFRYSPDRPVLEGIDIAIEPTETVALVGLSGAGKTTIVNLLTRFYDPTDGRITIDGIDIREVTLASLRARIGLVSQDIVLFNDTIRNNIAYGMSEVASERVESAARAAEAHGFICDLPKGYDTPVGERGGLLSTGQKQRLAIARALLKDPPILVLDEATSALDSESESLIQKALANIRHSRTTIIIAHRLSTVRSADKILVIDKGTIVERGTHEELCARDGLYRKLYDLQFPEDEEIAR
ncbi:MAG: ABC transporter ATP-binding protein [Candidatus Aminicenantes bacterium]|nr:ABC transporter ATP-binding protein [Candidatus Aminicenantes bacterium]